MAGGLIAVLVVVGDRPSWLGAKGEGVADVRHCVILLLLLVQATIQCTLCVGLRGQLESQGGGRCTRGCVPRIHRPPGRGEAD